MTKKTIFEMDFEQEQVIRNTLEMKPVTTYVYTSNGSGGTSDDGTKDDE